MIQQDNKATGAVLGMGALVATVAAIIGSAVLGLADGTICGGVAWVAFLATVIAKTLKEQTTYHEDFTNIHSVRW